jgi:hypothetical protein
MLIVWHTIASYGIRRRRMPYDSVSLAIFVQYSCLYVCVCTYTQEASWRKDLDFSVHLLPGFFLLGDGTPRLFLSSQQQWALPVGDGLCAFGARQPVSKFNVAGAEVAIFRIGTAPHLLDLEQVIRVQQAVFPLPLGGHEQVFLVGAGSPRRVASSRAVAGLHHPVQWGSNPGEVGVDQQHVVVADGGYCVARAPGQALDDGVKLFHLRIQRMPYDLSYAIRQSIVCGVHVF